MTNLPCCRLEFKLKGNRSYVHGTDIFNTVSRELQVNDSGYICQLKFNYLLKHNAHLLTGDYVNNFSKDSYCATGIITRGNGDEYPFALLPISASEIKDRYDYKEEEIANVLTLNQDDKSATLSMPTHYSLIEEAVASVKKLNNILHLPKSKKWLFTGIILKSQMPAARHGLPLKVVRRQIVANRFSKNDLFLDSDHLGIIDFALGDA